MFGIVKGDDYLADQDMAEIYAKLASNAIVELEHIGVSTWR